MLILNRKLGKDGKVCQYQEGTEGFQQQLLVIASSAECTADQALEILEDTPTSGCLMVNPFRYWLDKAESS